MPGARPLACSSAWTTFCTGVASRPPHSCGQLIAAHRPSFRRRCQSFRRSWLRETLDRTAPEGRSSSPPQSARNFGRFSSSHSRSSSRNAMSSGEYAKSIAPTLTSVSGFSLGCGPLDFTFSEDPDALREAVRAFLAREASDHYMREMADDERGFTDAVWEKLAELGWPGLLVAEANGGLGLGLVDMAVVMEEMGRLPFPRPVFWSAVAARPRRREGGEGPLRAGGAGGATGGGVARGGPGQTDPGNRHPPAPRRKGADWVLTGHKPLVLDGHTADWVIVVARTEEGLSSFLLEAPRGEVAPTMDPTRKAAQLVLGERRAGALRPPGGQAGPVARG